MIHYVLEDMVQTFCYLPYGIGAGAAVAFALTCLNILRQKKGRKPVRTLPISCLIAYFVIVLCITFLSRELGSRLRTMDLHLFSTWGRTLKSHALAIENVVLFVPMGYLCAWNRKGLRRYFPAMLFGLGSSLVIESLQLITGRGYFQLDDIVANTIGMLIGVAFWRVVYQVVNYFFDLTPKQVNTVSE